MVALRLVTAINPSVVPISLSAPSTHSHGSFLSPQSLSPCVTDGWAPTMCLQIRFTRSALRFYVSSLSSHLFSVLNNGLSSGCTTVDALLLLGHAAVVVWQGRMGGG